MSHYNRGMKSDLSSVVMDLDKALRSTYKIFRKFDEDRSGTLEYEEVLTLLKACNIEVSEQECAECLKVIDANGDGVWDFTEFMTFLGMIYSVKLSKAAQKNESNPKKANKPDVPKRKLPQ